MRYFSVMSLATTVDAGIRGTWRWRKSMTNLPASSYLMSKLIWCDAPQKDVAVQTESWDNSSTANSTNFHKVDTKPSECDSGASSILRCTKNIRMAATVPSHLAHSLLCGHCHTWNVYNYSRAPSATHTLTHAPRAWRRICSEYI